MKAALRPCPLCGRQEVSVLHCMNLVQAEGSPLPNHYDVVACPACGFVYADTPVAQADYDRYYAEYSKYEDPAVATGGGGSETDRLRLELLADRIAKLATPNASVLDIGCAGGGLLDALRRRGFAKLHGLDAAPACIRQVNALGIAATCTSLSQLGCAGINGVFDVIVLSHVAEHVVDLSALMKSAVKLLSATGHVYLETPDASRYQDFPFVPYYFFDSEHINHFDIPRLNVLGAAHGLKMSASGRVELKLGPGIAYPACWTWMARSNTGPQAQPAGRALIDAVERYIKTCRSKELFPQLALLAASRQPVIIWGAGSFAQRLFAGPQIGQCNIVAIADRDRNKQAGIFHGFIVQSPEDALAKHPEAQVVIAAAIHGPAIAEEIRRHWPQVNTVLLQHAVH